MKRRSRGRGRWYLLTRRLGWLRSYPFAHGTRDGRPILTEPPQFPMWVAWAVPAVLLALIVVNAVSSTAPTGSFLASELPALVLQPSDAPSGIGQVAAFGELDSEDSRLGAEDAFHSVFSDVPMEQPADDIWTSYTEGMLYVTSSALWFDGSRAVGPYLDALWVRYTLHSTERQRGPDGSWLVFNPRYQDSGSAPPVPLAAAGWAHGNAVMVVLFVGADSSIDALELAQAVQERVDTAAARNRGAAQQPVAVIDGVPHRPRNGGVDDPP